MSKEHYITKFKYSHLSGAKLCIAARQEEKKKKGEGSKLLKKTVTGLPNILIKEILIGRTILIGKHVLFPALEIRKPKNDRKQNEGSTT